MIGGILGSTDDAVGRLDVLAHPDRFELLVDVPGIARDDLDVTVAGGEIVISGRRHRPAPDGGGEVVRRFERRVVLGQDLGSADVGAHLAAGVLRLTVPRGSRARRVPIGRPEQRRIDVGERVRRRWQRSRARRGGELRRSLRRLARPRARRP